MITITNILDVEKHLADIDAVIFDLDDTLFSEKDYIRSGYRAVAGVFDRVEDMERKLWDAFLTGPNALDRVLEAEGLATPENRALALRTYRGHMPAIAPYPGVNQLLARLKETKKLGLITDGRPEGQQAKLQALGVAGHFDKIIVTDELGGPEYRKPNETAFRLMQQTLNVPFEKMAYIGDNTKKDFIAPQNLGMRSIYFRNLHGLHA